MDLIHCSSSIFYVQNVDLVIKHGLGIPAWIGVEEGMGERGGSVPAILVVKEGIEELLECLPHLWALGWASCIPNQI
jgi:hypothetical protein